MLRHLLGRRATEYTECDLGASAMVFSPHFDDETLGCGGLIARKTQAGAAVGVVFMTDGSGSHRGLISDGDLAAMRAREGRSACRVLGVLAPDVVTLGYPETRLGDSFNDAVTKASELLAARRPKEVFVPHRCEPAVGSNDHIVTNAIVRAAVRRVGCPVTVWEYGVWIWACWPWVGAPPHVRGRTGMLRGALSGNARMFRDFGGKVDVRSVLDIKRRALAEHRSQTSRLGGNPAWPVLADVSDGEFLDCVLQDWEFFWISRVP